MSRIEITQRDLSLRGDQIRKFLVPLAKAPGGPAWQTRTPVGSFIIGTHDGSPSASDYRDWRFSTIIPGYRAMYFELWIKQDPKWYLDRAYLSIFRIEHGSRDETELLCLHCDPNEPPGEHTLYKIGPHLHIVLAEHPIPHAHIALNKCHLDDVLLSLRSLSAAMAEAVLLIREEILEAI